MSNDIARPRIARRGVCLVVAAPSGGGKGTILREVLAQEPRLALSISATTRPPRPGEQHGVHYHFTDQPGFDHLVATGAMLEHATVFGRSYGTPRAPVEAALARGHDIAFDIDWQGHRLVRAALPNDVVSIFLLPPSLATLQQRLHHRGDTPADITHRMQAAQSEIAHWPEFDHVIVNDTLDMAVAEVRAVLGAARSMRARQTGLTGFVATLA